MFNIVLFEPEIPPNTGNIIRLCANTGCRLHLIEPLGFDLSEKQLKRAGLDYHDLTKITKYPNFEHFISTHQNANFYALSTKGKIKYSEIEYKEEDFFIFGPETRGLPETILYSNEVTKLLTLPMLKSSRSLNLSNTVSIVVYEAWRQIGFNI